MVEDVHPHNARPENSARPLRSPWGDRKRHCLPQLRRGGLHHRRDLAVDGGFLTR